MSLRSQSAKTAMDISAAQFTWSAWFLAFAFIAYLAMRVIGVDIEHSFATFMYRPSKVFMLVVGITSVSSLLTFYVKQGVTRKAYFFGAAIASCIVSIALVIIPGIVAFVEQILVPSGDTASFLGADASWLLTIIVFSLNILVYHMAGWLIGAGFYRFGGLIGMVYILLAIVFVGVSDILWEFELKNSLTRLFDLSNMWELPLYVSFISTVLLLGIALWIIRATTKKIRIKIK